MIGTTVFISSPAAKAAALPPQSSAPVYAFEDVAPNPIGVGQPLFVDMWLIEYDPLAGASNVPGTEWTGYTVTVTAPDQTTTVLGPFTASPASTQDIEYTPTQVGNYTFFFSFPGQLIQSTTANPPINTYYLPSNATDTVTVQQNPIQLAPETPLPTSYWERPIYWDNQLWSSISGNWYGDVYQWNNYEPNAPSESFGYNAYTTAPTTAHILWRRPLSFGGQIGGGYPYNDNSRSEYYSGKVYEPYFDPPIIINGVMFLNDPVAIPPATGFTAIDLRTGNEIYYSNGSLISTGEVFTHHNPNETGGIPYLWSISGSTYKLLDANTGKTIETITGVPGSYRTLDTEGELVTYGITAINSTYGRLTMWNSTMCIGANGFAANEWMYRPQVGATISAASGIQFNVTVPIFEESGTPSILTETGNAGANQEGYIIAVGSASIQNWEWEAGYSATTGAYLWSVNRSLGMIQETTACQPGPAANGIYTEHNKEQNTYYGFSAATGALLWGPVKGSNSPWDAYTRQGITDGNIVMFAGPGSIQAMSLTNGTFLWDFNAGPAGLNEASSNYLMEGIYAAAGGGGEYFAQVSNSHGDQPFRGAQLFALNITTGQVIWQEEGQFAGSHAGSDAIADGIFVGINVNDNEYYAIGQGQSATTVSAPPDVQTLGSQVLLQGTVTDQSPGQTCLGIPAAGTPAIADASQEAWMAYLYMQQPMPTNATGVPVSLDSIDPNGNYVHIGDVTTDTTGHYKFLWTPTIPGTYTIIANFAGTGSYYSSSAETAFANTAAAPTPPPTSTPAASVADTYFVPAIAGLFVLIIIVAIVLALLMLRKKP